jgi:hypothetical protein
VNVAKNGLDPFLFLKEKIPWDKNKKGTYWEPVLDGHKGTHDPHWDVQKPNGSHTPTYPPK